LNFAAAENSGEGGGAAGRGDLRQLLRANLPDPAAVRAAGIPPEFFHRLNRTRRRGGGRARSSGVPALGAH
jgi:hypothetical protein